MSFSRQLLVYTFASFIWVASIFEGIFYYSHFSQFSWTDIFTPVDEMAHAFVCSLIIHAPNENLVFGASVNCIVAFKHVYLCVSCFMVGVFIFCNFKLFHREVSDWCRQSLGSRDSIQKKKTRLISMEDFNISRPPQTHLPGGLTL